MRRWAWPTMGSVASLAVPDQVNGGARRGSVGSLDAAQLAVQGWFDEVERALSPYRDDSDLCRWRRGELEESEAPLLAEVMDACAVLQELTEGSFHPYDRQGQFDPTGYVKGWAIDRGAQLLEARGVPDAFLGIGGDVQVIGRASTLRGWRLAVVDPADAQRIVAIVSAPEDGSRFAIATSGESQRGAHIWTALRDSRMSGLEPAGDGSRTAAITVVGPDLRLADAYATAIFAGALAKPLEDAWAWLPATGYAALAVDAAGRLRATAEMAQYLVRPAA